MPWPLTDCQGSDLNSTTLQLWAKPLTLLCFSFLSWEKSGNRGLLMGLLWQFNIILHTKCLDSGWSSINTHQYEQAHYAGYLENMKKNGIGKSLTPQGVGYPGEGKAMSTEASQSGMWCVHRGDVLLWVWDTRKRTDDNDWGRQKRPRVTGTGWSGPWKQRKGRTELAIWKYMAQTTYQSLIKDRQGKVRRAEAGKRLGSDGRKLSWWMWTLFCKSILKKMTIHSYIPYMECKRGRSSK